MKKFKITVKSTSKVMQHKNNGKDAETTIGQMSELEQARRHTYFMDGTDELALPMEYFVGCLRDYMVKNAPKKTKKSSEWEYSSAFRIDPILIPTGVMFSEEIVDNRIIPIKKQGQIVNTSTVIRPKFDYQVSFVLYSSLDMSAKDLRTNLENAGIIQGIGSANKLGYGRFKVVEFEEIRD